MRWGPPSMSAFAQRALIGGLPPSPHYGGRLPGRLALASGGSEHKILHPSCLGDTGPYCIKNLNASELYGHRLAGYNRGSHSARSPPHQTDRDASGGVRLSGPPANFRLVGPKAREEREAQSKLRPPEITNKPKWPTFVIRGPGPTPPVRGRWPEGPEGVGTR